MYVINKIIKFMKIRNLITIMIKLQVFIYL